MVLLPLLMTQWVEFSPLPPRLQGLITALTTQYSKNFSHVLCVLTDLPSLGPLFNPADGHCFTTGDLTLFKDEYCEFAHTPMVLQDLKVS